MERTLTLDDTLAVALGAGILGTGGGGNTYIGRIWLEQELRQAGHPCRIIDVDDLPDDALVGAVGTMGAPTVGIEKLLHGEEFRVTVRALEAHLRRSFSAIMIGEIGGANSLKPLIAGLQLDLPVIDGDGMGRAFPELQMDTFAINGVSLTPMALGDSHGNITIFDHIDTQLRVEQYARSLTVEMGGSAALLMPVVSGRQAKDYIIRGTLTLAQRMGKTVLQARAKGSDPAEAIAALGGGRVLFRGKIADVERRTVQGFARGRLRIAPFGGATESMVIDFQNENLIAVQGEQVVCTVPDLICIVSLEDGEPIGTELLRYGLRVAVIGLPAAPELKTEAALKVVGPAAFGYAGVEFQPLGG